MTISTLDPTTPTDLEPAGNGAAAIRALTLAIKTAFPAVDAEIQDEVGGQPDAAAFTALFTRLAALESGSSEGAVGEIKVYYGSDPTGDPFGPKWHLCDGTNGTPNWIGRMLIQSDAAAGAQSGLPTYDGNSTGGAVPSELTTGPAGSGSHSVTIPDHTLTAANIPEHEHMLFVPGDGADTAAGGGALNGSNSAAEGHPSSDDRKYVISTSASSPSVGKSGSYGQETPTALNHSGASVTLPDHTHTLNGASLPPHAAVYYFMYTGVA